MRRIGYHMISLILFGALNSHIFAQPKTLFPRSQKTTVLKCAGPGRSTGSYKFGLERDSTITYNGQSFTLINSTVFRTSSFIAKQGEKVILLGIKSGNALRPDTVVSVLFDFGARPGDRWVLADSASRRREIKLSDIDFNLKKQDSIFRFETTSNKDGPDAPHLGAYLVSKKYGLIGLEFFYENRMQAGCYDRRFKSFLKNLK